MSEEHKPRRPYRSERRREGAAQTRQRILDAARQRFVEQGYAGTTIAAIAADAGDCRGDGVRDVRVEGRACSRRSSAVRRAAMTATRDPEAGGPAAVAAPADQRELLRLFATDIVERLEQVGPLLRRARRMRPRASRRWPSCTAACTRPACRTCATIAVALAHGDALRSAKRRRPRRSGRSPAPSSTRSSRASAAGRASATSRGWRTRWRARCCPRSYSGESCSAIQALADPLGARVSHASTTRSPSSSTSRSARRGMRTEDRRVVAEVRRREVDAARILEQQFLHLELRDGEDIRRAMSSRSSRWPRRRHPCAACDGGGRACRRRGTPAGRRRRPPSWSAASPARARRGTPSSPRGNSSGGTRAAPVALGGL